MNKHNWLNLNKLLLFKQNPTNGLHVAQEVLFGPLCEAGIINKINKRFLSLHP